MIRFICIVVFVILFLIVTIPVLIVERILHKFNPYASDISSLRIVQWAFKMILGISMVVKTTVIGEENVLTSRYCSIGTTAVILTFC